MSRVHAAFPPGTLSINAQLKTQTRSGDIEQTYEINIEYAHTNNSLSTTLLLRDAFGGALEKMIIENIGATNLICRYFKGEDLQSAAAPDLAANIGKTDFHWQDLTLSFLWWPDGELIKIDSLKNRRCYLLDIPSPEESGKIRGVKLWIDSEMYAILRAEFYDSSGKTTSKFDVKNFAKTGDLWMVKNIDMHTYPSRHKTKLRVREVERNETGDVLK